ncbi:MAG TPA: rhodanese-like domain-containing protein [Usitatibacter sp.]|jgi:rhodanese-related sulfurtransferase|nr:rhodanese-like domain-containing protein [Usitatibacter sp.]
MPRESPAGAPKAPLNPEIDEILARAKERGAAQRLAYAGAVTPKEAWRLHSAGAAVIVDVRTAPEREFVGRVPDAIAVEWRAYGAKEANPRFLEALEHAVDRGDPVLFLCRSGVRSHHAAELATRAGFERSFNILEGFEGDLGSDQKRGMLGGWRRAGLPWVQS